MPPAYDFFKIKIKPVIYVIMTHSNSASIIQTKVDYILLRPVRYLMLVLFFSSLQFKYSRRVSFL